MLGRGGDARSGGSGRGGPRVGSRGLLVVRRRLLHCADLLDLESAVVERCTHHGEPVQDAQSQAVALVPTYLGTIDDLYLDPSRPLDDLYEVAVTPEATAEATAIGTFRSQGYRQAGRSRLVTATADSVDLTTDPAASPSPALPTVVVTACVDVSHVQATDASGRSVIPSDRPSYLVARLKVVNPRYPDASSWRVSEAPNRQAQSCDG